MKGPAFYPVETIAKLLDLTPRRVQQLSAEGVIPRVGHGKYELVSSVRGYIRYLKAAEIGGDARADNQRLLRARRSRGYGAASRRWQAGRAARPWRGKTDRPPRPNCCAGRCERRQHGANPLAKPFPVSYCGNRLSCPAKTFSEVRSLVIQGRASSILKRSQVTQPPRLGRLQDEIRSCYDEARRS
jgi:hypothetical protein